MATFFEYCFINPVINFKYSVEQNAERIFYWTQSLSLMGQFEISTWRLLNQTMTYNLLKSAPICTMGSDVYFLRKFRILKVRQQEIKCSHQNVHYAIGCLQHHCPGAVTRVSQGCISTMSQYSHRCAHSTSMLQGCVLV